MRLIGKLIEFIRLLSNVILCNARILATIFLFHIRDVHMRNDIIVNGDVLTDKET
jgi:hypothetical protein